ncbi:anti-sigma factor antagonist [Streptomyces sp. C]|nr:anti-sigma factor antagonist [Streptomyces sp. C]
MRSAADARTVLHTALDDGHGDLVLDLTGLDSWDATGLGVIMGAHRRAGRTGRRLVLRGVPDRMQRLLVATRLHRILAIEGGLEGGVPAPGVRQGAAGGRGPGPGKRGCGPGAGSVYMGPWCPPTDCWPSRPCPSC